ncbi:zinc-binding dehydrogenase [Salmonella enterica subsp. enterica serovar Derby]|uniref:alcohol dehydrogenase catalytic domain-containing protein n=1 Tax=Salmonella TaxID=590 RepID=UPI000F5CE2CA|nr:alcohol dehydrogenase catalytic domain-containing protein [Salmonella enterica]EEC0855123.1 alcohol dehydrogenase catalytic domain-containing protein [Salmonella enterica subsp. enterica serovar Cerro]MCL9468116.1 alcohol dehydrogenase catalytic domain-containing protein [Salmonella enterica subsp. enterica serovar Enteritidis]ECI2412777.1 zinc-binding dehydrogenase [Salmonella enterica subsp. enterica serovar Derby]ECX6273858.1 alcohol dehydrogenase catalytic domain-containing protein [Salm
MKALNLYGVQDVRYEDVRKPEIEKENDVLIKVNTAGICGSDISRFGKIGSYNPGLTWGHEFSGIVESTGRGVTSVSKGDRVTACNCFPCFHCDYCKQGNFCVKDENYLSRFHEITYDKGVDIVFESSGNAAGISSSLLLAAKGGAVVLLGIPYGDVALPRLNFEKIVRNELKVIGSWNSMSAPFPGKEWQTSIHYLSSGKIDVSPLITRQVRMEDVPSLLPELYNRKSFFVKVLINVEALS